MRFFLCLIILYADIIPENVASPTVLVTRVLTHLTGWLPVDNQTVYNLQPGAIQSLELNMSSVQQKSVYISVSPCTENIHWELITKNNNEIHRVAEYTGRNFKTSPIRVNKQHRYLLQLSANDGGSVAVSVRGEESKFVRLRCRVRSKRRMIVNWDPSPIDPQTTTYCIVASHKHNYTSLCAARHDFRMRIRRPVNTGSGEQDLDRTRHKYRCDNATDNTKYLSQNSIEGETDSFDLYNGHIEKFYGRRKYSRSTKITNEDPVVSCVGERTHHQLENLDPGKGYYVSVFSVGKDRRAGSLLATNFVGPRTSTARPLEQNVPHKSFLKGKAVYYFKGLIGSEGGLWLTLTPCGGAVNLEVTVRGNRVYSAKNIDHHTKLFVAAASSMSSQEISNESSVQYDSSSEESKIKYVIKLTLPTRNRDANTAVEITASTTRWGSEIPELVEGGSSVREVRQKRSCDSVSVAFIPAVYTANAIRYCLSAREMRQKPVACDSTRDPHRTKCFDIIQKPESRIIVQQINGLKAGTKYAIRVTAMGGSSATAPYKLLFLETMNICDRRTNAEDTANRVSLRQDVTQTQHFL